jgi:hypothetical protein
VYSGYGLERLRFIVACAAIALQCGLFTPLDPEKPKEERTSDPFNFSEIINNSKERFSTIEYRDLFYESGHFYYSSGIYKSTNQFIDHLNEVINRKKFSKQSIRVDWIPDTSYENRSFPPGDTIDIHARYRVWIYPSEENVNFDSIKPAYEAPATFYLIYYTNEWIIHHWRDGYAGRSIFYPE